MNPKSPSCVAIIPARGGSKGLPGKNIRMLAGKPLIAWTIEVALQSPVLNRVIVTTESMEIAEAARSYGAEVPFMRPEELARDDTPGTAPLLHAVHWLQDNENWSCEFTMLLQPTSPLRVPADIERTLDMAVVKHADSVVSVSPVVEHPYWVKALDADGRMRDFITDQPQVNRRQDAPPLHVLNGAIYLVRTTVLVEQETLYTENTYGFVMPPERSLDIDTAWDLYLAELILKDRLAHASN